MKISLKLRILGALVPCIISGVLGAPATSKHRDFLHLSSFINSPNPLISNAQNSISLFAGVSAPAATITSTSTGGNWSSAATWVGGVVPGAGDDVKIANGATVTIDTDTPALGSLTVGQGRSGILQYDAIAARTVTVSGIVIINSGGTFRSAPASTASTVKDNLLVVGVSLINNGTIDFCINSSGAGIKFIGTTSGNSMFNCEGAAKTNLQDTNGVVLEMNNPGKTLLFYPGAEFKVCATTTKGFLTIVSGIFKVAAGASPFSNPVFSSNSYTIPATGGFELSNANATVTGQDGTVTNQGKIIVSAGTYNIGTASGNSSLTSNDGTFAQSGGTINIAGNVKIGGGNCNITGGTMNIARFAPVAAGEASFFIAKEANLNITGSPLITFATPNSSGDLFIESGGAKFINGGTFQMGTAATPKISTFTVNSEISIHRLTNFDECTIRVINTSKGLIKNDVNGAIPDGDVLALSPPENITVNCNTAIPVAYSSLQAFINAGGKARHNCTLLPASFKLLEETQSSTSCPYTITRTYKVTDIFGSTGTAQHLIFVEEEATEPPPEAVAEIEPELRLKSATGIMASSTFSNPANNGTAANTFTVPAGVTQITVELWGAGGGGSNRNGAAGGGGGGAYTRALLTGLTPLSTVTITVGAGGAIGLPTAAPGNFSRVTVGATTITANGGLSVNSSRTGGAGGTAQVITGVITAAYAGGNGGNARAGSGGGSNEAGGGGGGSGFTTAAGNAGGNGGSSTTTATAGGTGTGNGGVGAAADGNPDASAGIAPGGGGGGRGEGTSTSKAGANGMVKITYFFINSTEALSPICSENNTTVTLTATNTDDLPPGTYTVTYDLSGMNISANNNATMVVSAAGSGSFATLGLANSGNTTITIKNIASGIYSNAITANNTATFEVKASPAITTQPSAPTATCSGTGTQTLTVSATGDGLTYNWRKGGVDLTNNAVIGGQGTNTLTLTNPTTSYAGNYDVVIGGTCSPSVTSNSVAVTILTPPAITDPPDNKVACVGSSASFTVVASGNPAPTYQWRKNGTNISGANSATYTIASVSSGDAANYDVVVTNSCGTTTSVVASLLVDALSIGGSVSGSATVCSGSNSGTLTLSGYFGNITKWQSSTDIFVSNIVDIDNTTASQAYSNLTQTTSYRAVVKNGVCDAVPSTSVTITVNAVNPGVIAKGAVNPEGCTPLDPNLALSSSAASAPPTATITYSWEQSTDNGATWQAAAGTTTSTPEYLTFNPDEMDVTTKLRRVATSVLNGVTCSATSIELEYVVYPLPDVERIKPDVPITLNVCVNSQITLTNDTPGGVWSSEDESIATVAGGIVTGVSAGDVYIHYTVTNVYGCSRTRNRTVHVIALPEITTSATSVCVDGTMNLTPSSGGTWVSSDPTKATVTDAGLVTGVAAGNVTFTFTDSGTTCSKTTGTISVIPLPTVSINSTFTAICQGGTTPVLAGTVGGSATGGIWTSDSGGTFSSDIDLNATWTPPPGFSGTATLTLTSTGMSPCSSVAATKVVEVIPTPGAGSVSADQTICFGGDPVAFTSTAAGSGSGTISYRWESSVSPFTDWNTIAGETTSTYNVPSGLNVTTHYRRITISTQHGINCESVPTTPVIVTVQSVPTPGTIGTDQTICYNGNPAAFTNTSSGTGSGTITYRWENSVSPFSSWSVIAGATAATYDAPAGLTVTTKYRRTTISTLNGNSCESGAGNEITVTVQSPVDGGEIGSDQSICLNGDPVPTTSIAPGTGDGTITYRWERSVSPFTIWSAVAGATGVTYDQGIGLIQTTQYRRVTQSTVNGVVCEAYSNAVTIAVQGTATAGTIGSNQTICNGATPLPLTSVTDGTGSGGATITYIWERSADNGVNWSIIAGEELSTYAPPALTQTTMYRRSTVSTLFSGSCISNPTLSVTILVQIVPVTGAISGNQTICNGGDPVAFTSTTNGFGSGVISYRWESSVDPFSSWSVISGATTSTYDVPAGLTETTKYRRTTISTIGGVACEAATPTSALTVTVQSVVLPGTISGDQTICLGSDPAIITSTTQGSGSGAITYRWESSVSPFSSWTPVSGATSETYDPPAGITETTRYRRISISTLNGVTCESPSNTVTKTTIPQLIAPVAGSNQTICYNTTPAALSATAATGGSGAGYTYQWQSSADGNTWADISGQTGLTYTPGALTATRHYRVVVTDPVCGTANSNTVVKTVYQQLTAPTVCCDQFVCQYNNPGPITAQSAVGGSGTYTYQWQVSNNGTSGWTNIGGATGLTYTPPTQSRYYRIIATDVVCGTTATSSNSQVSIATDLGGSFPVSDYPSSAVCSGYSFTARITSASITGLFGNDIRYSWTADPLYVSPPSGGPVGYDVFFGLIFRADIPLTLYNNTDNPVTTTIWITPTVYSDLSPLTIYCSINPVSFNVTINPFKINQPTDISANNSPGSCTASISLPARTYVGTCSATSESWSATGATTVASNTNFSGTKSFNVGETTVTYTATNTYGATTTTSFKVTVTDTQAPIFTSCPGNISRNVDAGQCTASINTTNPVVSDNCGAISKLTWALTGSTVANSPATGINNLGTYTFNPGVTTVTYTATDAAGNSSTCSYTVTVNNTPTFATCPGNYTADAALGGCAVSLATTNPTIGNNCLPLIKLTWAMTGATVANSPSSGVNYVGTHDFNGGTTAVTYTATDTGGNIATCSFTVTVNDKEPPIVICLSGYNIVTDPGECTAQISTTPPLTSDNCSTPDLTWTMTGATVASGNDAVGTYTFNKGTTTVKYTLTDDAGNTDDCSYVVTVTDSENPTVACLGATQNRNTDTGNCTYTANSGEFDPLSFNDNCSNFTLTNNLNGNNTLDGYPFPVGTTTVIWTIIDAASNMASCSFNVTVTDAQKPVLSCIASPPAICAQASGKYTHSGTAWDAIATDNCTTITALTYNLTGVTSGTGSSLDGIAFNAGTTTVTWSATDAHGNSETCNFNVIVNSLPVVTAPASVNIGETITLSPTTGGTWTSSNTALATVTNAGVVTGVAAGFVNFTFTNTTTGCSATTTDVEVLGAADLKITKTGAATASVGLAYTYTIAVENLGPVTANGFTINDAVPASFTNPQFSTDGGTNWNNWTGSYISANPLPNGATMSVLLRGTPNCTAIGTLNNTAEVALTTFTDPAPGNNTSTLAVTVTDDTDPEFTLPSLATTGFAGSYCPEDIWQAEYSDAPYPNDLTHPRPDYYLFGPGFTILRLTDVADNCALRANPDPDPISWTIDFGNDGSVNLSGTGQLEDYVPIAPALGIEFPIGTNRITYTVTDKAGNKTEKYIDLVVLPRPVITKIP